MPFSVAIVGKTNVGKSTLLNAIAKKKFAITSDMPGVTRDRKEVRTVIAKRDVILVDTAGLEALGKNARSRHAEQELDRKEAEKDAQMYGRMIEQSIRAIKAADLVLFVIDGLHGVTEEDYYFADIARKNGRKVVLVVNKGENPRKMTVTEKEIYKFGFSGVIFASAEHAVGIPEIHGLIKGELESAKEKLDEEEALRKSLGETDRVHIAIIGRPNAGKSTLVNRILGEERVITGEKAGITRDAVSVDFTLMGRPVKLVDTAGIRKNNDKEGIEKLSIYETMRSLRLCHVAVLMLDATNPFVQQDLALAGEIASEGRILIVALNKADLLKPQELEVLKEMVEKEIGSVISDVYAPAFCVISALEGEGLLELYRKIFKLYVNWNTKIKTNTLNNWLKARVAHNPPPLFNGREVKIKYISQIKIRPPAFVIFANKKDGVPVSYVRYLANSLIKDFGLEGINVRFSVREQENPYKTAANSSLRPGVRKERLLRQEKKSKYGRFASKKK